MDIPGEKRQFPRLSISTDVEYTRKAQVGEEKASLARNISKGGICIISYEELKESELLDLKIHLLDYNTVVNAVGRVAWVKEFFIEAPDAKKRFDIGIEFVDISDSDKEKIDSCTFKISK